MIDEIFKFKLQLTECDYRGRDIIEFWTDMFNRYGYDFIFYWILFQMTDNSYKTATYHNVTIDGWKNKKGNVGCDFSWGSRRDCLEFSRATKLYSQKYVDEEIAICKKTTPKGEDWACYKRGLFNQLEFNLDTPLSQQELDKVRDKIVKLCSQ